MRRTQTLFVMILLSVGLPGAYWGISAQEGHSLWAPPPVLPPGETPQPALVPVGPVKEIMTTPKIAPAPVPRDASPLKETKYATTKKDSPAFAPVTSMPIPKEPIQTSGARRGVIEVENPVLQQTGGIEPSPLPINFKDSTPSTLPQPLFPGNAPQRTSPAARDTKDVQVPAPFPAPLPTLTPMKPQPQVEGAPVLKEKGNSLALEPLLPLPKPTPGPTPALVPLPKEAAKSDLLPALPEEKSNPQPLLEKAPAPLPPVQTTESTAGKTLKSFVILRPGQTRTSVPPPSVQPGPPALEPQRGPGTDGQRQDMPSAAQISKLVPRSVTDSAAALVQMQTPSVVVEKRCVVPQRPGEAIQFQILVRNLSSVPATQVRIEDDLPADARLLSAEPAPQMQGKKAVWVLSPLPPHGEQVLRLSLQTGSNGPVNQTSLHVSVGQASAPTADSAFTTVARTERAPAHLQADALLVRLLSPDRIVVGQPAVFEIKVTNQSAHPVRGMILYGSLPEGLTTPEGSEIEGAVDGILQVGETKSLKMPAKAVKAGRYLVRVKVATENHQEASAQTNVEIGAEALLVHQIQNNPLLAGRNGDYRIVLTNPSQTVLRNVTVVNQLPAGLDFVTASDRGLFQANSRAVHWLIDQLRPGQTKVLLMRVHAVKTGQYSHLIVAKADGGHEARSSGVITVQGVSDLSLKVLDRDNPLEVGRETVYEIQVQNPGHGPSTNVQLQVQFPDGLIPRAAQGTGRHSLDRQTVVFEPITSLGPQGKAVYRISALAQVAGDQRVRFAVTSEQVRTPITREISTMVYRGE